MSVSKTPLTELDVIRRLKELQGMHDAEAAHSLADELLCEFLEDQGFGEIVAEYNKVEKWYA